MPWFRSDLLVKGVSSVEYCPGFSLLRAIAPNCASSLAAATVLKPTIHPESDSEAEEGSGNGNSDESSSGSDTDGHSGAD